MYAVCSSQDEILFMLQPTMAICTMLVYLMAELLSGLNLRMLAMEHRSYVWTYSQNVPVLPADLKIILQLEMVKGM